MEKNKINKDSFINNIELYIATICFFMTMFFLLIQVISRYVFHNSITWVEEAATLLFIWMTYFGIASAVLKRKHLKIEFVLDALHPKAKKILLIFDNIVFGVFNIFVCFPLYNIITNLRSAKTTMLHIPKKLVYLIIPVMLILTTIRLIQDIIILKNESGENIGGGEASIDVDALEKEYLESRYKSEREVIE